MRSPATSQTGELDSLVRQRRQGDAALWRSRRASQCARDRFPRQDRSWLGEAVYLSSLGWTQISRSPATSQTASSIHLSTATAGSTTDLGPFDEARSMAIDSQDRIVVAGSGAPEFVVGRYKPNGELDPSFGSGGLVTAADLYGNSVAIDSEAQSSSPGMRTGPTSRWLASNPAVTPTPRFQAAAPWLRAFGRRGRSPTRSRSTPGGGLSPLALRTAGAIRPATSRSLATRRMAASIARSRVTAG